MVITQAGWQGRCKQFGGKVGKLWGRITRNAAREFRGDQSIIEGKLEEYYAVSGLARGPAARTRGFVERRRSFHVVA